MKSKEQAHTVEPVQHPMDETGFRLLFDFFWKRLLAFCRHHTGDEAAAMDIVQDIFCSVWKRRAELRIETNMEHYLFRAARIRISDYYRTKFSRARQESSLAGEFCGVVTNTEETVYFRDLGHYIDGLVNRLPYRCREVYILSRNSGLTIPQIATRLSIAEKTAEAHLTKALGFLREHLDRELKGNN